MMGQQVRTCFNFCMEGSHMICTEPKAQCTLIFVCKAGDSRPSLEGSGEGSKEVSTERSSEGGSQGGSSDSEESRGSGGGSGFTGSTSNSEKTGAGGATSSDCSDSSDEEDDGLEAREGTFTGSDWVALLMGASGCDWEEHIAHEEQAMEADQPDCLARRSSEVYRELQEKITVGHHMTLGELCASMVYLRKVLL